jgi:hypothetical protein
MLGIAVGMRLKVYVSGGKIVLEHIRDALWYAIHGPKVGYIGFNELEEESVRKQGRLLSTT